MSNTLTAQKVWQKNLQNVKREDFVGMNIADTKFSSWKDIKTIVFARQDKITIGTLANYNASITVQDIVQQDEEFTPNQIRYFAFKMNIEEDFQNLLDPKGRALMDSKEGFANEIDYAILGEYANADYVIDDGDLAGGTPGDPITLTETNVYELFVRLRQRMTEALCPQYDRFFVYDPEADASLFLSDKMTMATESAEKRINKGYQKTVLGIDLYVSNNIHTVTSVRHCLAGQGKPIAFGSVLEPKVFISDIAQNLSGFWSVIKGTIKFGVVTFKEGSERLWDVQIAG